MGRLKELGFVETIYEAEEEEAGDYEENEKDDSISSLAISSETFISVNLSSDMLQFVVDEWGEIAGCKPDVVIRVLGHGFLLHREVMSLHSSYFRRRLSNSSDVTVCPPLIITVEAFTEVARFCYSGALVLTPLNLAPVLIAAELLEIGDGGGEWSIARRTEEFFRKEIAGDEENAASVLGCCLRILSGGGAAVTEVAARCVHVLTAAGGGGVGYDQWIAELMAIPGDMFGRIIESMAGWSVYDHDHLYRIADQYFVVNKESLTEEEKLIVCRPIECGLLSHKMLLHLVRNPRLPLRFIFRATLLRRTADDPSAAAMAARIQSLERDVAGLRSRLNWSEEKRAERGSRGERSKSFRYDCRNGEDSLATGKDRRGRGLRRKVVEGLRRLFRKEVSGDGGLLREEGVGNREGAGLHVLMNKYLAFY